MNYLQKKLVVMMEGLKHYHYLHSSHSLLKIQFSAYWKQLSPNWMDWRESTFDSSNWLKSPKLLFPISNWRRFGQFVIRHTLPPLTIIFSRFLQWLAIYLYTLNSLSLFIYRQFKRCLIRYSKLNDRKQEYIIFFEIVFTFIRIQS